ncbi:hypothetical protein JTB14_015872 [Gonioctena quinquepunctata]|nr:hypothetical protein JTB14_015872 [Gonioctena quinquepunctata]
MHAEYCGITYNLNNKKHCLIVAYRPPSGDTSIFLNTVTGILNFCTMKKFEHVILCGDINIDFNKKTARKDLWLDVIESFNLSLKNTEPTRISKCGSYRRIIDYALALFRPVNSKTIHQKNSSSKEWVNKEIIEMGRRLKNLYWLKVNTHEQTGLNEEYKCFKKEYERKVSYTKHTHYQSRINDKQNITEKQKYFWKLVREKNGKTKNNQPPEIVINNKLTTNKTVIADEFANTLQRHPESH